MNIILMTILLTILGMCLVALLVWLGICSIKFIRFRKKTETALGHLEKIIDDDRTIFFRELQHRDDGNQKRFEEIRDKIDNNINDVHNRINNDVDEINRKIDSRCDKLQNNIDANYQLLKITQKNLENK